MARRKKTQLALPAQANRDLNTVKGIMDRWAVGAEDLVKDVFDWGKKHKMLVALVIGLVALKRYWLDEEDDEYDEEE